jgi:hypothetical protein
MIDQPTAALFQANQNFAFCRKTLCHLPHPIQQGFRALINDLMLDFGRLGLRA